MTLNVFQEKNEPRIAGDSLECLRPGLHLLALRTLGNADAAEEAVQETLARAVVALARGQLADPTKTGAFVAGIARHVIVDAVRARQRIVPLETLPLDHHPRTDPDPLAALVSAAERDRVRSALALLPAADRTLLQLCYYEGLTAEEVAARSGEPSDRIRKRKSRALERLRAAFRGGGATCHTDASDSTSEKTRMGEQES